EEAAKQLVELFRVDMVWPIGTGDQLKALSTALPHLINPFFHDSLFIGGDSERKHGQVLDIENAISYFVDRQDWQRVKQRGVRLHTWHPDDPLADYFLVQLGAYPRAEETRPFRAMLERAADAIERALPPDAAIPGDVLEHFSISSIARLGLQRH